MAVAAKEQESAGMDKAELKKSLTIAKRAPMHVALALDGTGAAIVVLDKIKKGETIVRELKQKAKDSKSHRFGMCVIDEDNPKRAIFTVNKAAGGGMARKIIKALKGTGFSKVIVKLEDGTIDEQEEDEDEEEEGGGDGVNMGSADVANGDPTQQAQPDAGAEPAPAQTADMGAGDMTQANGAADATLPTDDTTMPADPTAAAPDATAPATGDQPQQAAGLNVGDLARQLTALAKQMLGVIAADPTQKTGLVELATSARASLEKGDLQQAGATMDLLRETMNSASNAAPAANGAADPANGAAPAANGAAPASNGAADPTAEAPPAAPPAPPAANGNAQGAASAPTIAKARTAWVATRQKIEGDLGKLHIAFGSAFKGHDQEEQISKAFRDRVETVLNALDEGLAQTLDAVNNATDPNERTKLVQQAHAQLATYQQHVASDQTIAALDNNPFVPLAVQKTVVATISALSRTIR